MEPTPSTLSAVPTQDSLYTTGLVQEQHDALDAQPPLTPVQRIVDTFIAPTKTFADIRRNRSWWPAFVVISLIGYLFAFACLHHVGLRNIAENVMKANPQQAEKIASQSPEQQAATYRVAEFFIESVFYAAPVFALFLNCVKAFLLWSGFNFLLGGKSTFKSMFAVTVFASFPAALKLIIETVLAFASDPETFNLANPIGTNPGFYLGVDSPNWLRSLLTSFDLFDAPSLLVPGLWSAFLLGLGGAIVARVKTTSGYILVFGAFAVVVLIKTGFAAFTS